MGRKRPSDPERDGPPGLEHLPHLGAQHSEFLDIRRAPLPNGPGGLAEESPEPRIDCCLIVDVSRSMFASGGIDAILTCLPQFKASVLKDSLLARKLSWSVVAFADRPWVVSPYGPVGEWEPPAELPSSGGTAMGTAVIEALRLRGEHLKAQAARGIASHHSFGFLLTDGQPTEPAERVEEAARLIEEGENGGHLSFFCLAVEGGDIELLKRLTPRRAPLGIAQDDFAHFFRWLYKSMSTVSASQPGVRVKLRDPIKRDGNPDGWGYA